MKRYLILLVLLFTVTSLAQNYSVYPDSALRLTWTTGFGPVADTTATIEFWVKRETNGVLGYFQINDDATDRIFITGSTFAGLIYDPDSGLPTIIYGDSAVADIDKWVHCAIVIDTVGTDSTWVYQGSQTVDDTLVEGRVGAMDLDISGLFARNQNGNPFDGKCDEYRLWSTARTLAEINANKLKELTGNETGLLYYWKFNNDLTSSATANTLTEAWGSASYSADSPLPQTYYVSDQGSDSNDGITLTTAWLTVDYAASTATQAGDIILLFTGDEFREMVTMDASGTEGSPITVSIVDSATGLTGTAALALGDTATISGANLVTTWTARPVEDYTGYTEVDAAAVLDVVADSILFTAMPRDADNYVYFDYTAGYFSGDFKHSVTINIASADAFGRVVFWALGNAVDDFGGLIVSGIPIGVAVYNNGSAYKVQINIDGSVTNMSGSISVATKYYITIRRDESVGANGTLYCDIYDDAGRTSLVETVSAILGAKTNYRYIYACSSLNSGSGATITGWVRDLVLGDNVWQATATTQPTGGVWFNDTLGTEAGNLSLVTSEYDWFWASNLLYVYSTSDADANYTSPGIESAVRDFGIYNNNSADYITINSLNIEKADSCNILSRQNIGWTISNCTISGAAVANIFIQGDPTIGGTNQDSLTTISNNIIGEIAIITLSGWNSVIAGIVARGCEDLTINDNTFATVRSLAMSIKGANVYSDAPMIDPQIYGNTITNSESGILVRNTVGGDIYNNHIYNSRGFGMQQIYNDSLVLMYYNLIHDLTASTNGSLYNGIDINFDCQNGEIYNNTIYTVGGRSITVEADTNSTDGQPNFTNNFIIKNNIFHAYDNTGGSPGCIEIQSDIATVTLGNNDYYFNAELGDWKGASKTTLAAWVASSSETGSIDDDPLFTDAANADFLPLPASPCLNAGTFVGFLGPSDIDYAGISIEYPPDIGAYEFDSGIECPDLTVAKVYNRFLRYKRFLSWGGAGGGAGSSVFPYTFPFCLE